MQKSPISILQEYAMAKGLALPNYTTVSEGGGIFKCIVHIGNVARDAKAPNKKKAKTDAAERALSALRGEGVIDSVATLQPLDESDLTENKVGELNEFCSRIGISYPSYVFEERSGAFASRCKLLAEETEGRGKTKKEAKQYAAKRMLEIVTSGSVTIEALTDGIAGRFQKLNASPPTAVCEETSKHDQMIIELFKQLSFKPETGANEDAKLATPKNLTMDEIDLLIEEARDGPSLENLLANLGVDHAISTFQRDPLVLCVTTKADKFPSFTFLLDGTNESELKTNILKLVVDAIAVHL